MEPIKEQNKNEPEIGKNEAKCVSNNDDDYDGFDMDRKNEYEGLPNLIPWDEESSSSSDEDKVEEEDQDRSCAFQISTHSVLAEKAKDRGKSLKNEIVP